MDCDGLATCPFFNDKMAKIPLAVDLYKRSYCKGDFSGCARYMVKQAFGKEPVPADLYPNEIERAREILRSRKP
jgi:hypothetical protein